MADADRSRFRSLAFSDHSSGSLVCSSISRRYPGAENVGHIALRWPVHLQNQHIFNRAIQSPPPSHGVLIRTNSSLVGYPGVAPDIALAAGLSCVVGQNLGTSTKMLTTPSRKHLGGEGYVSILCVLAPGASGSECPRSFCVLVTVLN